jgi:hypothetical protein
MRVLFDQGTPLPLRHSLAEHDVRSTWQQGWSKLANGDLLAAAEAAGFDVFVTTDQQLRYQQHLTDRRLAILVLMAANWPILQPHAEAIAVAIQNLRRGEYKEWSPPVS